MQAWYLIYSKPRQEQVALENLLRQGYGAYMPLIRASKLRQRRRLSAIQPMFPRYLFIHLSDSTDDWGPIRSTKGVVNLVRFGAIPAKVPNDLIVTLRGREDESGLQVLPESDFRHGDRVRISEGVMAGYEAIFQARTGRERVVLLLDVAGKSVRAQVSAHDIEPVS